MLYNMGEVLSDQFDHFKLILFWVHECSFQKKIQRIWDKVVFPYFPVFFWQTSLSEALKSGATFCGSLHSTNSNLAYKLF